MLSSSLAKKSGKEQVTYLSHALTNTKKYYWYVLMCFPELVVDLVEEVTRLQETNTCLVEESARLSAENARLVEDHTQLRDQSMKMTEEVKSKNQEITSKWPLSCSWFYESNYVLWHRFNQNALAQH
jgi:regulator of replication initiation timing